MTEEARTTLSKDLESFRNGLHLALAAGWTNGANHLALGAAARSNSSGKAGRILCIET